jgi:serine/threonine-protein kinase
VYDVVKVLDFGLVKEISEADGNLTQTDLIVGTPFYMAPETIRQAGAASPASDIYSLGAVAYFLLTAANVFEGGSAVEICSGHLHDEPVPPSQRIDKAIPADLEQVVLQCLAKQPGDRPSSAAALEAALAACEDANRWGQADAREWWRAHGAEVSGLVIDESAPMSRTEMLIDMDTRLQTGKA